LEQKSGVRSQESEWSEVAQTRFSGSAVFRSLAAPWERQGGVPCSRTRQTAACMCRPPSYVLMSLFAPSKVRGSPGGDASQRSACNGVRKRRTVSMIDPITVISLMAEALGLSIDLKEAAKAYAKKVRDTERQSFVAKWRTGQQKLRGMRSDLTRFLHEWYSSTASASDDFLGIRYYSRNDSPNTSRVLPLVTKKGQLLADNPNFRGNAEYCGRLLEQNPNSHVGLTDDELVEQVSLWSALGMKIFDAPLYSLQEVSAEGDMKFRLTRFFVYRPTFGALPDELTLAVADHRIEEIRNNPDEYLPLRSKILPDLQVLTEFAGRIVAGGPAVLFAVTLPKGDVGVLLQRRSRTVSDEQGVFSVVPKAFHQPM